MGDAVGAAVEFKARGTFAPVTDMMGGGPFGLAAGQWTDDTSMALCLATSLLECGGFDARDQMDRYRRWARQGELSSTGTCFDIGRTVAAAIRRFEQTGDPVAGSRDPHSAGNGSIMRLAPIPLFYFPDLAAVDTHAAESSRTTHGAPECIDACRLLGRMICRGMDGQAKDAVTGGDGTSFVGAPSIVALARGVHLAKPESAIRGTGYVVDSLEAALWCFETTDTFQAAILRAANLGDDSDTTAAVCGQLAGAFYGASQIPTTWLHKLSLSALITDLADRMFARTNAGLAPR